MFNKKGQVIGIVSHILSKSGGYDGIVSSNTVKEYLASQQGLWAGIKSYPVDQVLTEIFNIPQPPGSLLIEKVIRGSLSERLGIKGGQYQATIEGRRLTLGGDILLEIMDISLSEKQGPKQIKQKLAKLKQGDDITVKVLRQGKVLTLTTKF